MGEHRWKGWLAAAFCILIVVVVLWYLVARPVVWDQAWQFHMRTAETALQHNDTAFAERELRQALSRAERFGAQNDRCGVTHQRLGELYVSWSRPGDAETSLRQAVAILSLSRGPTHPDVASAMHTLAVVLDGQRKFEEAERFHRESIAIRERVLGPMHPDLAVSLSDLGAHYRDIGRHQDEEERLTTRALEIRKIALGEGDAAYAQSLYNLADLRIRQGRFADAVDLLSRSLTIARTSCGPESVTVAVCLAALADAHTSLGKRYWTQAEGEAKQSLALLERGYGPQHTACRYGLKPYLRVLQATGRHAQARVVQGRLDKLRDAYVAQHGSDALNGW